MTLDRANELFDYPVVIIEPFTELYNDLLNSNWVETEIHSPRKDKLSAPDLLPVPATFGKALLLDVVVTFSQLGNMDDFLDDIIVSGYFNKNWKRRSGMYLLALHVFSRPLHSK